MSQAAGLSAYEVTVEDEFCAAHALLIGGVREPVHGHNWRVRVTVAGDRLDGDGLLVDFHALERVVGEVLGPFRNADLNRTAPFDRVNPSAELVARHIAEAVQAGLVPLSPLCRVVAAHVTEAAGCSVVYRPIGPAIAPIDLFPNAPGGA